MVELMKKNGEWDDNEEGGEDQEGMEDMIPDQSEQEQKLEEDEKADRPGDEHMFEQFLKSGGYQSLGKRNRVDFDDDELVFATGKRTKADNEIDKLIKSL